MIRIALELVLIIHISPKRFCFCSFSFIIYIYNLSVCLDGKLDGVRSALAGGGDVNVKDCAGIRLNLSLSFISPPPAFAPSPSGIRRVANLKGMLNSLSLMLLQTHQTERVHLLLQENKEEEQKLKAENERFEENESQETFKLCQARW